MPSIPGDHSLKSSCPFWSQKKCTLSCKGMERISSLSWRLKVAASEGSQFQESVQNFARVPLWISQKQCCCVVGLHELASFHIRETLMFSENLTSCWVGQSVAYFLFHSWAHWLWFLVTQFHQIFALRISLLCSGSLYLIPPFDLEPQTVSHFTRAQWWEFLSPFKRKVCWSVSMALRTHFGVAKTENK